MDAKKSQIRQEALNVGALPTRPPFDVTGLEPSPHSNCYLTGVEYVDGYPLIAESAFGLAKSLESTWKDASARASSHAYVWAGELWHRVNGLDLTSLYDASDDVPEFCSAGDLHHLRLCYPELSALADGTLFWHFDTYNRGYCYSGHWTARRDDAFLFFLLGTLASKSFAQAPLRSEEARAAGEIAGFALLRGENVTQALEFALAWHRYNGAITTLARALAEGIQLHRQGNGDEIHR